jgi:hypothetical protein
VLKGIEALMRHQQDDGRIGIRNETLYTHAICAITLAEAYGRARDERVGAAAQKALNFAERAVAKDGGWRYQPNPPASDMSVTAWFVQALKTGRLAGLKTDQRLYNQALTYVDSLTDKNGGRDTDGTVSYTYSTEGGHSGNRIAMTAAGMMIREFNGVPPHSPVLQRGAELIKRHPPNWKQKDFYYWYYATYAMHNMGGANRIWWNQRVRDVLLDNQSRDGDRAGSWDPTGDHWAKRAGGRVYTTALGALCLEVYYRYSEALTAFGTAPDLDDFLLE